MDNYTITGRIGEGAHGLVLKAIHNSTGNNVAIKKVSLKRIDDGIPASIIREVKTLQELDHPYVRKKSNKKMTFNYNNFLISINKKYNFIFLDYQIARCISIEF